MKTTYLNPIEFAKLLASTSLKQAEKERIINKIPSMSASRLEKLYLALENLKTVENNYIQDSKKIDLKFQIETQTELAKK
jgi:hypothetical protein